MRKHISLGFILASALAATTIAIAAPSGQSAGPDGGTPHGWHGGGHGRHGGHGMGLEKLNLTDTQKASIKQIMHASFDQNKTQRQALRQQRDAFRSMTPDQVGYQAAASRLAQAEGEATQLRVQQRAVIQARIYAVLTSSQKAQLATMKTERETRKAQWQKFKAENQQPAAGTSAQ